MLLSLVLAVLCGVDLNEFLAALLADVLAGAILIPPRPPTLPTNIRKVRGFQKSTEISNTKTMY